MPLIQEHTDSLPYIDRPLTPTSLTRANTLIAAELSTASNSSSHPQQPHALLPPPPSPSFTPLIQSELDRITTGKPLNGIDLHRYEGGTSEDGEPATPHSLKAAYTNAAYLSQRLEALELLDQFGKNAWLVGNSQLEDILRDVERELMEAKEAVEGVNRERKEGQERGKRELEDAERAWREGVRGAVEASVAVGGLEERIRETLREKAAR